MAGGREDCQGGTRRGAEGIESAVCSLTFHRQENGKIAKRVGLSPTALLVALYRRYAVVTNSPTSCYFRRSQVVEGGDGKPRCGFSLRFSSSCVFRPLLSRRRHLNESTKIEIQDEKQSLRLLHFLPRTTWRTFGPPFRLTANIGGPDLAQLVTGAPWPCRSPRSWDKSLTRKIAC